MVDPNNIFKVNKLIVTFLRKMLKCKRIPKFKKDLNYLWLQQHVHIIPIGIREDDDLEFFTIPSHIREKMIKADLSKATLHNADLSTLKENII